VVVSLCVAGECLAIRDWEYIDDEQESVLGLLCKWGEGVAVPMERDPQACRPCVGQVPSGHLSKEYD
jgi:hypothetical protein